MLGTLISLVTGFGWVSGIAKVLKFIPWQVYIALGLTIGVLYYGHWSREQGIQQGREEIVTITAKAAKAEVDRQAKEKDAIIQEEHQRAEEAVAANAQLQKEVDDAIAKANASPTAGRDCLPADSLRRLRDLR